MLNSSPGDIWEPLSRTVVLDMACLPDKLDQLLGWSCLQDLCYILHKVLIMVPSSLPLCQCCPAAREQVQIYVLWVTEFAGVLWAIPGVQVLWTGKLPFVALKSLAWGILHVDFIGWPCVFIVLAHSRGILSSLLPLITWSFVSFAVGLGQFQSQPWLQESHSLLMYEATASRSAYVLY